MQLVIRLLKKTKKDLIEDIKYREFIIKTFSTLGEAESNCFKNTIKENKKFIKQIDKSIIKLTNKN
jgi:hypothetical protein